MKNICLDQKLNLEEIFTCEEIKSLKKSFPKINILIRSTSIDRSSNSNLSKASTSKTKSTQIENSKDKIYVYKMYYYKLILEETKNKYEQEGNNIMIKSFTCLLDDLFHDDKLYNTINKNNSNSILIYSDDRQKNEKLIMHNKKQMSMAMLPEKRLNEMSREILFASSLDLGKNNKINKDEKTNSKSNFETKKIKSPSDNYKNIYYYNIINSKKIINNNNYKNDENKNVIKLKNKKFTAQSLHPTNSINYSMNFQNNLNKSNHSNISYFNYKNSQPNNFNNYISSIQIYNQTEQNKNNKLFLNKKNTSQTISNGLIDGYNNINYTNLEKKKESYKKYSKKKIVQKDKKCEIFSKAYFNQEKRIAKK